MNTVTSGERQGTAWQFAENVLNGHCEERCCDEAISSCLEMLNDEFASLRSQRQAKELFSDLREQRITMDDPVIGRKACMICVNPRSSASNAVFSVYGSG